MGNGAPVRRRWRRSAEERRRPAAGGCNGYGTADGGGGWRWCQQAAMAATGCRLLAREWQQQLFRRIRWRHHWRHFAQCRNRGGGGGGGATPTRSIEPYAGAGWWSWHRNAITAGALLALAAVAVVVAVGIIHRGIQAGRVARYKAMVAVAVARGSSGCGGNVVVAAHRAPSSSRIPFWLSPTAVPAGRFLFTGSSALGGARREGGCR